MRTKELACKYDMKPHEENGKYICCHYADNSTSRPKSGSIYYYVSPGEHTSFHSIDCDEYWIYNAGSDLEIWSIDKNGELTVHMLGTGEGACLRVYLKAGDIFASRLKDDADDGTFLTCITVPRFAQEGFRMYERDEIIKAFPVTEAFWK